MLSVGEDRVVVQNINMIKRHTKGNPMRGAPGGIVEKEASLHVSNVALFNTASGKADRAGVKTLRTVREFASSNPTAKSSTFKVTGSRQWRVYKSITGTKWSRS